jgi:hypothetical protein
MTAEQWWSLYLPWGGRAALVPALAEIAAFGELRLDGAFVALFVDIRVETDNADAHLYFHQS